MLTVSVGNGAPFTSSSPCATSAVTITVNNGSLPAVSVPFTACAHYGILSITYASLQSTVGTSIDMPTQPSVGASSAFQYVKPFTTCSLTLFASAVMLSLLHECSCFPLCSLLTGYPTLVSAPCGSFSPCNLALSSRGCPALSAHSQAPYVST